MKDSGNRKSLSFVQARVKRLSAWPALMMAAVCLAHAQSQTAPQSNAAAPLNSASNAVANNVKGDPAAELAPSLQKFISVLSTVQAQSAEQQPLEKLVYEGAIPSMLRQLDPHTQFFGPAQFEQLKQMEDSEQKGFGSVVSVLPGRVIFLQILPGTPTGKAGIQPGDELVAINNIAIGSLEPEQIVELLTEAKQQKITVYVRREGQPRPLQFFLSPELVDAASVDRAFILQPGFGFIRVTGWDMQTAKQLKDAIEKLHPDSLTGLVLDLRNNPGGVVKAALDAAAMFLQAGQRILTVKGRTSQVDSADVPKTAHPYGFKVAVLINEKTASASEILSGALQDHDRAVIIGEPSYGKGLVQSVMPLSAGTGLAITTAFYYTPSGRSIQKPLRNSALSQTFSNTAAPDKPVYKTDKGRVVTGGGGIQPDIVVHPANPTRLEAVLDASGSITSFATQYLASHSPLPESFAVQPDLLDEFKVYLSPRNIQPSISEWGQERPWLTRRLAEEIITQARGVDKGDEIQARSDPQVLAALNAMKENALSAKSAALLRQVSIQ